MKAFPTEGQLEYRLIGNNWVIDKEQGMDLRDYFAAKAMAAIIIASDQDSNDVNEIHEWLANYAYKAADLMMERRKQND